ncbi:major capsid protein [Variovorax sp.]|uniref:major capsid protein n=1 Tax=Variovorax sp. TaxID=1871043 RepID=UPI003BAC6820
MAIVGNTYLTLADLYKQKDPNGNIADVIELLAESNPILDDMIVVEANDGTTHLTTMRTGIPSATFRRLYQAVQPKKSTTKQVRDATGMMENWSEIDAKLVDLSGNPGKLRLNEATAFIEGLSQTAGRRLFYGNTATDPEEFLGFAPRFGVKSAENGAQIIDAGGTGSDNASIWFVVWGERTVHALYPKGSKAGISRDDKGKQTKDVDGGVYDVYREKFSWDLGLSVRDWRYVTRIANIDVSEMQAGNVKLYDFMRKAYYRLRQRRVTGGRAAIYANTDVLEALDALATNAGASDSFIRLRPMEIEGKEVLSYRGIPIRETDALLNTEARVV